MKGAAVLLEAGRSPAEAITLADVCRHNWIVTVADTLTLHDRAARTTAEVNRKTLTDLGRGTVEDGRR
jgi:hypothetical protein